MLRSIFRGPRSVRVPLQNGTVDIQRVAIARRSKSAPIVYRLFKTIAVTYFVARTINYIYPDSAHGSKSAVEPVNNAQVSEDRAKAWREQWDRDSAVVSKDGPEVIHLMLPLWIRQQKPQPWKPDDPTWKSFQALDGDKKRLKEVTESIKKPLMKVVLSKYSRILMDLGGKQDDGGYRMGFHESWRLAPPLYAPATYEVPCIFLESGKKSYGWRQVPNSVGGKMDRIFHPIVLAKAFCLGLGEFTWASYLITRARMMDQFKSLIGDKDIPSTPQKTLTENEKALKQLVFGRVSEKNKEAWLPFLRGEYGEHESRRAYRDLVKSMTFQGAIESACAVFRAHWIQGQEKSMQSYTGDGIILRGNLAFVGEKGTLFLHAVAVYSPETNSIIGPPIIKDAYLSPNMEKWVEKDSTEAKTKGLLPQDETQDQVKAAPQDPLKPRSQREDPPRKVKSSDRAQEENGEK